MRARGGGTELGSWSLEYPHLKRSACAERSLLERTVPVLKPCALGAPRSRSVSPNPERFPSAGTAPPAAPPQPPRQPAALGCHCPGAREAGAGPELTPTRAGAGGGAAARGAGAGRGPDAQLGKGRDRGTLAAAAAGPGRRLTGGAAAGPGDRP